MDVCTPDCTAKQCGDDGCGGSCGDCIGQDECIDGQCVCQPDCEGKTCGDDGCGGSCGNCNATTEDCTDVSTGGRTCAPLRVEIPAGNFWMGCNNCPGSTVNDTGCDEHEHPYHEVYLDTYEIDRTEVTAAQYLACKNAGGCSAVVHGVVNGSHETYEVPGKEDHPVNYVSWSQAEDYCQWVGKELCTEAQWEKGARAGCEHNGGASSCKAQSRKYPWGNDVPTCSLAVMTGCDGYTQPVCSLSPAGDSPYGLCGMAGNVTEWTADWYKHNYYCDGDAASGDEYCTECGSWPGSPNAWDSPFCTIISGSGRIARGGCFGSIAVLLRVSERDAIAPSTVVACLGFRCCRSE